MNYKKFKARCRALIAWAMAFSVTQTYAQEELWVLSETPPALGMVSMTRSNTKSSWLSKMRGMRPDLEIRGDEAIVVLENRVVKVDLVSASSRQKPVRQTAKEATLLDDGTVVVTRGGLDDAWQPLDLLELPRLAGWRGPQRGWRVVAWRRADFPSQEVALVEGKVYVAVNNGWSYTEEVGVSVAGIQRERTPK